MRKKILFNFLFKRCLDQQYISRENYFKDKGQCLKCLWVVYFKQVNLSNITKLFPESSWYVAFLLNQGSSPRKQELALAILKMNYIHPPAQMMFTWWNIIHFPLPVVLSPWRDDVCFFICINYSLKCAVLRLPLLYKRWISFVCSLWWFPCLMINNGTNVQWEH